MSENLLDNYARIAQKGNGLVHPRLRFVTDRKVQPVGAFLIQDQFMRHAVRFERGGVAETVLARDEVVLAGMTPNEYRTADAKRFA